MSHHTNLMKSLRELITFEPGSIGSPCSWKRMSWTPTPDSYTNEEIPVPEGDEAKALDKKNLVMEKRIIADSIKDHLIP